jgi:transcriptional regulator with XRE-family HTH domain
MKGRYVKLDSSKMRWHRDRLGWTLDTLAEQAEVAEGTALRAEHGEDIRPSSGRRIARALGVDISELVPEKPGVVLPKAEAPSTSGQPNKEEEDPLHEGDLFDVVYPAVLQIHKEEAQQWARAHEAIGIPQTRFARAENDLMAHLLKYPRETVIGAFVTATRRYVRLEEENARLREEVAALQEQAASVE